MARPRRPGREHWPIGLNESKPGYFIWTMPPHGEVFAIGRVSEEDAIKQVAVLSKPFEYLPEIRGNGAMKIAKLVYSRAKVRRKRHEGEFLSEAEFFKIWQRARGRCELTGIALSMHGKGEDWRCYPWAPSLDRINGSLGYTAANCRLVCIAVNMALNEFGEEVLRRIAMAMVKGYDASARR